MKRNNFLIIGLLALLMIIVFFFSSVSLSGGQGDEFYSLKKEKDYETIIGLIDQKVLINQPVEQWINLFENQQKKWGNLVSYKNTGFHTETVNGKKIAKLDYLVIYSNCTVKERIELVKRRAGYRIIAYECDDKDVNMLSEN
ncbi:MAG: hypothetical protein U0W24_24745 [Bacteroidales bacterium]